MISVIVLMLPLVISLATIDTNNVRASSDGGEVVCVGVVLLLASW